MDEFYHVSRKDISTIKSFELQKHEGHIEAETLYSSEEFIASKVNSFPNGLSNHGRQYLQNPFLATGPKTGFTKNEFVLESTFELIRKSKFPNKNSRFTSSFGCLSLEDARRIKKEIFGNTGQIYKVSCDNYTVADMKLLRQSGSIVGLEIVAEKYWSGKTSTNPFLEVIMENPVKILAKIE